MASYKGHLMLAAPLGAAYGAAALLQPRFDWGVPMLGASLCTVGGLLPDLDSDSGVAVRELFGLASALTAVLLLQPVREMGFSLDQTLALLIGSYLAMRYVVSGLFCRMTVHRGMFHSIPATLIAGLAVYLAYPGHDLFLKLYLGGAVMVGYLSHLVLDELYSIDFNGVRLKFNQFAGTALKFGSPSWQATLCTYAILICLGYVAWNHGLPDFGKLAASWRTALAK
ncbi:MAG: metal-dependent hydrolase [Gemmataceae bacterium]|nr:metal-dependent hydrolase [Gemmataceae bacterium]